VDKEIIDLSAMTNSHHSREADSRALRRQKTHGNTDFYGRVERGLLFIVVEIASDQAALLSAAAEMFREPAEHLARSRALPRSLDLG
jgi:hypothetical protein